ncbi:MAG: class I SAM-dependent methyltransferase [Acidobacteriota bacterium]
MKTDLPDQIQMGTHSQEVASGQRFEFGANWSRFLELLDEDRILAAEESLRKMLGVQNLTGRSFIDIGSGSGLFSLAARRLGARVHSFDYDPKSYACTKELQRRFFSGDPQWVVESGSVLDPAYLARLGTFDIVYSWGVLHHTGSMWEALKNVEPLVAPSGLLFIAIYNDQGKPSRRWLTVKKAYNRCPKQLRFVVLGPAFLSLWWRRLLKGTLQGQPLKYWTAAQAGRGMSHWRDVVDWVGGYPFEVATPEEIFDFYHQRGYTLTRLTTQAGDLGCNEFVFRKNAS